MSTHIISEQDILDRFNFWAGLFGFEIEKDDSVPADEFTLSYFTCYSEDTGIIVHAGIDLEDFARVMRVVKPWEDIAEKEDGTILSIATNNLN